MKPKRNIINKIAQRISFAIIIGIALFIIASIVTGCRAQKSITETHVEQNDSASKSVSMQHDTIIIHDTVYVNEKTIKDTQTNTNKTIHFGEGGGTYNEKTGDATNVSGVDIEESKVEHELRERIEQLTHENTTIRNRADSLQTIVNNYSSDAKEDVEPVTMNGWERFMYVSGIVAWCVIVILIIIGVVKLLRKFKVIPV
jgi:hypothetical protein